MHLHSRVAALTGSFDPLSFLGRSYLELFLSRTYSLSVHSVAGSFVKGFGRWPLAAQFSAVHAISVMKLNR